MCDSKNCAHPSVVTSTNNLSKKENYNSDLILTLKLTNLEGQKNWKMSPKVGDRDIPRLKMKNRLEACHEGRVGAKLTLYLSVRRIFAPCSRLVLSLYCPSLTMIQYDTVATLVIYVRPSTTR